MNRRSFLQWLGMVPAVLGLAGCGLFGKAEPAKCPHDDIEMLENGDAKCRKCGRVFKVVPAPEKKRTPSATGITCFMNAIPPRDVKPLTKKEFDDFMRDCSSYSNNPYERYWCGRLLDPMEKFEQTT